MKLIIKGHGDKKYGYGEDGRLFMTLRKRRLLAGEWEVSDGEEWPIYSLKLSHEGTARESLRCELTRLSDGQCLKSVTAVQFPETDPKRICKYSPAFAGIGGLYLTLGTGREGVRWEMRYQRNGNFDLLDEERQKIGQIVLKSGRWECELSENKDSFLLCILLFLAKDTERADSVDVV